jgi:CIC family chloride channel protein
MQQPEGTCKAVGEQGNLLVLALLAFVLGTAAGLLGAGFRLALAWADRFRDSVVAWAHGEGLAVLPLVVVSAAGATALAAWLVRRFSPEAKGSGIPHVEKVLMGKKPPAPLVLIPVKFVGGLLAMGAGLALGREGPSVQMGASLGQLAGTLFRCSREDGRALLAAGAGAGLATAFNAPIAGAIFVLEELVRRFDTRITITTFGTSAGAIAVARVFLGDAPDFQVQPLPWPSLGNVPLYVALGIAAGFLGVAYNHAVVGTFDAAERMQRFPAEARAALIGAAVGLLAWFAPGLVGGGDALTQQALAGPQTLWLLSLVFLLRFALGAVSYAAGTPGGLFAPMLVLGAQTGLFFGILCCRWVPSVAEHPTAFAVVGMAAFFTAVVRAPLTGIVLAIEMTASFALLLPMLLSCFAAMVVPTLLRTGPIYDLLRQPASEKARVQPPGEPGSLC